MKRYPVITLCGSTRFKSEFMEAQKRLTLEGNIVISVGLFGHSGDSEVYPDYVINVKLCAYGSSEMVKAKKQFDEQM